MLTLRMQDFVQNVPAFCRMQEKFYATGPSNIHIVVNIYNEKLSADEFN